MPATLQLDDLHSQLDNHATRHVLDAREFGSGFDAAPVATVTLYQLIPLQQHERPFVVRVELHDDYDDGETIHRFDNQREAEAQFEAETEYLSRWYADYADYDFDDEDED